MAFVKTIFGTLAYLPAECEAALRTAEKVSKELEARQQEEDLRQLHDHLRRMDSRYVRLPKWAKRERPDVRPVQEEFVYDFFFEGEIYTYKSGRIFMIDHIYSDAYERFQRIEYQIWPAEEVSNPIEFFDWDDFCF